MKKPEPLPFQKYPFVNDKTGARTMDHTCPKCLHCIESWDIRYDAKRDILHLRCAGCDYKFTMWPADRKARGRY